MYYRVMLYLSSSQAVDYGGGYTFDDVLSIVRGWKYDDVFSWDGNAAFTRKNSKQVYYVNVE